MEEPRGSLEEPGGKQRGARKSLEETRQTRRSREEPGGDRRRQEEPGGAKRCLEEPGVAWRSLEESRSSLEKSGGALEKSQQKPRGPWRSPGGELGEDWRSVSFGFTVGDSVRGTFVCLG